MAGTGFGAGFVEGATAGGQLNNQRDQIEALKGYRDQELGLKAQQFMLEQMRLSRKDAKEFYDDQLKQHNALVGAVTKGMENGKAEIWHQNPEQWESLLSNLSTSQRLLAGARANAYGGTHNDHLKDVGNTDNGILSASSSLTDKAFSKALADRTGLVTGNQIGLPGLAGAAEGVKDYSKAIGGGAAAAGANESALAGNRQYVIPPSNVLMSGPGTPAALNPASVGMTPAPTLSPGTIAASAPVAGASMPAAPVAPVASAPLPAMGTGGNRVTASSPYTPMNVGIGQHLGEVYGKMPQEYMEQGNAAQQSLHNAGLMGEAAQKFSQGKLAGASNELKAYARSVGIDLGSPAGYQEFMKAAMSQAFDNVKQFTSRGTQLEIKYALETNPSILQDPEAVNRLLQHITVPSHYLAARQQAWNGFAVDPRNRTAEGTPDVVKFEHQWQSQNPVSSFEPGKPNYKPPPGTPAAGVRVLGGVTYIQDPNSPSGWSMQQ